MSPLLALDFNTNVLGPGVVLGIAAAGLYGVLAISLVLTYRVSRTIGFVQGGIALFAANYYWWATTDAAGNIAFGDTRMGPILGTLSAVAIGAVLGVIYGATVTGKRLANWPRLNLTTYSLAWLLLLAGVTFSFFQNPGQKTPSVFGVASYEVFGGFISRHQMATLLFLVGVVALLGFVLVRTQTGIYIRAIADDVEASRYVGISLNGVGTGVYAFSGAMAAFAGVLLASTVGTDLLNILVVFLRALTVAILGGMTSFSLALAGCVLFGVGEATMTSGVFGPVTTGSQEVVIMSMLFGLVLLINRIRPIRAVEAAGL
jgi:branched-subunit amino acid ABC-type transport system permease component